MTRLGPARSFAFLFLALCAGLVACKDKDDSASAPLPASNAQAESDTESTGKSAEPGSGDEAAPVAGDKSDSGNSDNDDRPRGKLTLGDKNFPLVGSCDLKEDGSGLVSFGMDVPEVAWPASDARLAVVVVGQAMWLQGHGSYFGLEKSYVKFTADPETLAIEPGEKSVSIKGNGASKGVKEKVEFAVEAECL